MTVVEAIQGGDVEALARLLAEQPELVRSRINGRTLLHIATDWPGHFPRVAGTIEVLIAAGAEVNARGPGTETPLHWAASSNDVDAVKALIAGGADIEADGAVIAGGTPMADAVAFGCWDAARLLLAHGAKTNLWQAAALGLLEQLDAPATADQITQAFWLACHGGQPEAAELLLGRGADINWRGYDKLTPMGAARRAGAATLVEWLRARGASF